MALEGPAFRCALRVAAPGAPAAVEGGGCALALPRGAQYAYKFIVDGRWEYDPKLPHTTDSARNVNNVLVL